MIYDSFPDFKYNIGDRVWILERNQQDELTIPCKTCDGKKTFTISILDSETITVSCPKCYGSGIKRLGYRRVYKASKPMMIVGFDIATKRGNLNFYYRFYQYANRHAKYAYWTQLDAIKEEYLIFRTREEAIKAAIELNKDIEYSIYKE